MGKSISILGNLQRIQFLQTLVCLFFTASLGIVFGFNFFEFPALDGSIKEWFNNINLNSILFTTASILGLIYLFVRNMLFLPAVLAISIPILAYISPVFQHPVFFMAGLNFLALISFPVFYYKYKDLGWIIEINRFLFITFLGWISFLGITDLTGQLNQEHLLTPTINGTFIPLYFFTFGGILTGVIFLLFKKLHQSGFYILLVSLLAWMGIRISDGAYLESIPLTFLFLQSFILFFKMKRGLINQFEFLRSGVFKLIILLAILLPVAGFSQYIAQLIPQTESVISIYTSKEERAEVQSSKQ